MSYAEQYPFLPQSVLEQERHERHERKSSEGGEGGGGYALRPSFKQKFRSPIAKQMITQILNERLERAIYDKDQAPLWAREIAEEIKFKLLDLDLPRYKYIVNVTILENKGAGSRMQVNCFWDSDTDNLAQDTFKNDTIICVAMAFGVFLY